MKIQLRLIFQDGENSHYKDIHFPTVPHIGEMFLEEDLRVFKVKKVVYCSTNPKRAIVILKHSKKEQKNV